MYAQEQMSAMTTNVFTSYWWYFVFAHPCPLSA